MAASIKRLMLVLALLALPQGALAVAPVVEVKTKAGVTAWLIEDHALPIVSLRLVFRKSGAAYSDPKQPGLPLLASRMLGEGAGKLTSEAFNAALQDDAIGLSFGVDHDHFSLSLDALAEHFERGMELAGSALAAPRLEEGDIARVKEELLTERKLSLQQPGYLADLRFRRAAYGSHPYAVPLHGDEAALAAYDANAIRAWLAASLRRGEAVIAVVGDVTAKQLSGELDTLLARLPEGASERPALIPTTLSASQEIIRETAPFPQTVAVFATPGIARGDPDFYAAYLMNYLLGGGNLDSRLTTEVRKKRGLTYSVFSALVVDDASNLVRGGLSTRNEQAAEALRVVRQAFADAHAKGFSEAELKQAKDYITGSFPLDIDAGAELVSYLLTMQLKGLPKDYLEQRNRLMQAVGLADLNRVAKRLLDPDSLLIVTVGGTPASDPASSSKPSTAKSMP